MTVYVVSVAACSGGACRATLSFTRGNQARAENIRELERGKFRGGRDEALRVCGRHGSALLPAGEWVHDCALGFQRLERGEQSAASQSVSLHDD